MSKQGKKWLIKAETIPELVSDTFCQSPSQGNEADIIFVIIIFIMIDVIGNFYIKRLTV